MVRHGCAAALVILILASACASPAVPSTGVSQAPSASVPPAPTAAASSNAPPSASFPPSTAQGTAGTSGFTAADVDAAVQTLAEAGVTVRTRPADAPVATVAAPRRVEFLRFQVRNMALEAHAGGGFAGTELAAVSRATEAASASHLIAAWARTAETPPSRAARALIGDLDAADPATLRIPMLGVALFLADLSPPAASAATAATNGSLAAAASYCDEVATYLTGVLEGVLEPSASPAPEWVQQAIALYPGELAADPEGLRRAVGAMALLVYVTSVARPWTVAMSATPLAVHHIVGGDELSSPDKAVRLIVRTGEGTFPDEVRACAELAQVQLDGAELEGTPVTWIAPAMARHGTEIEGDLELDENGAANYEYQTVAETQDAHDRGTARTEVVPVAAVLQRRDIDQVRAVVRDLLTGGRIGAAAPTVQALYARLQPQLDLLASPGGAQAVVVTWHDPPEPTPPPAATGTPATEAVWVHYSVSPNRLLIPREHWIEIVSCNGPWGTWKGVFRAGGIVNFSPIAEIPIEFTVGGSGEQTTRFTTPIVTVPMVTGATLDVGGPVDVTIDEEGKTMTMTMEWEPSFGGTISLPIEPAPSGRCPH